MSDNLTCKVVIVGDTSVGKTSIIDRFAKDQFQDSTISTFGCMATSKILKRTSDGRNIQVFLWDTAGQEKYRSLSPVYFRGSDFAIVTYDVTNEASLDAVTFWINQFRSVVGESGEIVIAANKSETIESQEERDKVKQKLERKFQYKTFLVSAKANFGLQEMFQYIADKYVKKGETEEEEEIESCVRIPVKDTVKQKENDEKGSCC